MPDVRENERLWSTYDWGERGDEWSGAWRSPDYQWWGTLYPRLRHYLPARTILEIAPGFGRWTHYLLGHCDRLIGIDLMAGCVEACAERFRDEPKASFHQNDGRSLDDVPDGEVDLAFRPSTRSTAVPSTPCRSAWSTSPSAWTRSSTASAT
jgi:hypothetical protein